MFQTCNQQQQKQSEIKSNYKNESGVHVFSCLPKSLFDYWFTNLRLMSKIVLRQYWKAWRVLRHVEVLRKVVLDGWYDGLNEFQEYDQV